MHTGHSKRLTRSRGLLASPPPPPVPPLGGGRVVGEVVAVFCAEVIGVTAAEAGGWLGVEAAAAAASPAFDVEGSNSNAEAEAAGRWELEEGEEK